MVKKITESVKDRAFLLRSTAYGDDHRILSLLSEGLGRVDVIALGARKSIKRFSGLLDFVYCLDIEYRSNPRGGLPQLLHCDLAEDYGAVRGEYDKTVVALKWLRLISRVLPEGQNVPGVFTLLQQGLRRLQGASCEWVDSVFLRNLLARLGFHLEFGGCVRCRTERAPAYFFVSEMGGLLCHLCRPAGQGIEISRAFPPDFWEEERAPTADLSVLRETQRVLEVAFRDYLGVEILSKNFGTGD